MATLAETVELLVGGTAHAGWERYEIDSDLLTPADAWHFTLGPTAGAWPAAVVAGAAVTVRVGGETVLTGRIDEIGLTVDKRAHTLTISGRDDAAVLVDCSAPIFVRRQAGLDEVMASVVRPLGITKQRVDAAATRRREKINVEPGDTAWQVLANAAEANGLWPWFEPDGTLVVGGPDYDAPEVAALLLRHDGTGNNVLSLSLRRSIAERYSHWTVLGQTHGTEHEQGKHGLGGKKTDPEMAAIAYRPKIEVDHESDSTAVAEDRAEKHLRDARLRGYTLTAIVKGHRIDAPGQPGHGRLWAPGQRVRLVSEPHGIDAPLFLMGRKFTGGRAEGSRTELTLKEDRQWVIKAHPHKRKHRRGKNGIGSSAIANGGEIK
jgi:prophage tail gpP-like protein